MKCVLIAGLAVVLALACCTGCMTHTVTGMSGIGTSDGKPATTHVYWVWQRAFWQHK
jgi:ABC-type glycerol-3-phosphate transport system substrate-binding protein